MHTNKTALKTIPFASICVIPCFSDVPPRTSRNALTIRRRTG